MKRGRKQNVLPLSRPLVGVDCEMVDRWRALLPAISSGNMRMAFTEEEHAYCHSFADAAPHYAGRWCAKEAVVKALSSLLRLTARDVAIVSQATGRPTVARKGALADPSIYLDVSIAHAGSVVVAVAVATHELPRTATALRGWRRAPKTRRGSPRLAR